MPNTRTEHTPGPWVPGDTSQHETMIIGRGGKGDYICHVQFEQHGGGVIARAMEPARRANARLITAAPDLYEASLSAADLLEQYAAFILTVSADDLELHPYQPAVEQAVSDLHAAIAKARGAA